MQIQVLIPSVSQEPLTTFNVTGNVEISLVPVLHALGFRLYLDDYTIDSVVVVDSSDSSDSTDESDAAGEVDTQALTEFLNFAGEMGLQIANQKLAEKVNNADLFSGRVSRWLKRYQLQSTTSMSFHNVVSPVRTVQYTPLLASAATGMFDFR